MEISLRPWTDKDLNWIVENANNKNIADNMTDGFPYPFTIEKGRAFIEKAKNAHPANFMAILGDQKLVGGIGIHPLQDIYRLSAELGYWIAEPYWRKGIAREAIELMCDYSFKNFQIDRIFARPFERNIASQRVLEHSGFNLEAKFEKTIIKNGKLENELVYAIRRKL